MLGAWQSQIVIPPMKKAIGGNKRRKKGIE
jgi:hypothetical protein